MSHLYKVHVSLLDEGTEVWRPVDAELVGPSLFRLLGTVPNDESWEFLPGTVVRCENRLLSSGMVLVAIEGQAAQ
jgi:hypothetical protein